MGIFSRRLARLFVATLCTAGIGLAVNAKAFQCDTFGPMAPSFRTSQSSYYDQIWSEVGHTTTGFVFAWCEGNDILMRRYDPSLNPISNDTLVNPTLNVGTQDEPAICGGTTGNVLIAWSERNGYDGEQMGIFGRVYNAAGAPLAPEFQLNQIWQASQWRPLIAPAPGGGFAVAWSGDWDGNAYYRLFSSTGAPLTGDILVNQYTYDAQVDPAIALGSGGNAFVAFVDFSSHAGYSGTDLYGRIFNPAGVPLTNEFLIPSTWNYGDQRTPRVATDGQGHFVVVWTSEQVDGNGYAIVARRFDAAGNGLGAEFQVNTTTTSDQVEPRIAMQTNGGFLITWQDYSTGISRALCRRFQADGTPKGGEVLVNDSALEATLPEVWMSTAGDDIVCAYEVWNGMDYDVYARHFADSPGPQIYCTGKVNSLGCTPQISYTGSPSASSQVPFDIAATSVFNMSPGLLFYGYSSSFTPFQGGTLCLVSPHRTAVQISGGPTTGHDCSGTFHYDFNARIRSGIDPNLTVGRTISAQYYSRDMQDPTGYGSSLTNAVRFTICP